MALQLLDEDEVLLTNFHAYVDGVSGGVYEFKVLVKNTDVAYYYTGVQLKYIVDDTEDWYDPATSRISVRMIAPSTSSQSGARPAFADWADVAPGDTLNLRDIGSFGAGSTIAIPVWIRVFVPGNTQASVLNHGLKVTASKLVA